MNSRLFLTSLLIATFLYSSFSMVDSQDEIFADITDPVERMNLLINQGDIYEYSDPLKAISYYQLAFETGTMVLKDSRKRNILPQIELLRAKCLRYIGIVHSQLGNYDEALDFFSKAQEILNETRNYYTTPFKKEVDIKIGKLLNNIGMVYSRIGLFNLASNYYMDALEIYVELTDSNSIAIAYNSLGIVEARQANLWEALNYFQEALEIYTTQQNKEGMAQTYNNIGGIYFQLNNWNEALKLYKKAHEVFEELDMSHRVAATLGNIGLTYQNLLEFDTALDYLKQSLDIRVKHNYKGEMVESYNNLGTLYTELKDYESANYYFSKSYELASQIGEQRIIALSLVNLGRGKSLEGNINEAINYTIQGLDVAREHNLKFVVSPALEQLAELYAKAGNYRQAYDYSRQHYIVSQEILDEQKSRQINELEIGYKAREKQQQIEILQNENELNQLKASQAGTLVFILALLLFLAVVVGVFTLLLLRQRNKITLLKKEQEARSLIRKTDNDLKAILKTHAHAMILFDNELNVIAFNNMARKWAREFLQIELSTGDSLFTLPNAIVNELVNGVISESLKGQSKEVEKEMFSGNEELNHFKFFSNPVFDDSEESIQSVSLMIENITDRKSSEARILSDLREKETLIKEIHHRVKNNMQVIISLIRLQTSELEGKKDEQEAFIDLEQRISAMSYVHEELYKSHNLADINFNDYLRKISTNLISIYNKNVKVRNHLQVENNYLNIDIAVPCGLIVNELLTNALKHAFNKKISKNQPELKKQVDIYFSETETEYHLQVIDNGTGMKKKIDLENISSMGFHLVKIIAEEQLRGIWNVKSNGGLQVSVAFPKK
ncbi:MAG: tetratricopeptide repeat protein [Bacteroidales bacterium]|nr:tetratricopeptide repeat protein [Bacteroidales bacterium]